MFSNDKTFCVIEFIQKPDGFDAKSILSVVPGKWIKQRHQNISVLLPKIANSGNVADFFKLIPEQSPALNWSEYLSNLVYGPVNFEDACAFLKKTNNQDVRKLVRTDTNNLSNRKRCLDGSFINDVNTPPKRQMTTIMKQPPNRDTCSNRNEHLKKFNELLINFNKQVNDIFGSMLNCSSTKAPANKSHVSFEEGWSSEDEEVPNEKSATSAMPPGYDQNNTRWTLKHPIMQPGLQKLVEGYEVYIDSKQLNEIRNFSKNEEQLVRLLMLLIFDRKALAVCTYSGRKSPGNTPTRPGLDKDGTNAILKYVYCLKNNTKGAPFDKPSLVKSMRKKLLEVQNQGQNKCPKKMLGPTRQLFYKRI